MIGVLGRVPDPVYLFDADPDSTFHFFPDPYPWLRVHFETLCTYMDPAFHLYILIIATRRVRDLECAPYRRFE